MRWLRDEEKGERKDGKRGWRASSSFFLWGWIEESCCWNTLNNPGFWDVKRNHHNNNSFVFFSLLKAPRSRKLKIILLKHYVPFASRRCARRGEATSFVSYDSLRFAFACDNLSRLSGGMSNLHALTWKQKKIAISPFVWHPWVAFALLSCLVFWLLPGCIEILFLPGNIC